MVGAVQKELQRLGSTPDLRSARLAKEQAEVSKKINRLVRALEDGTDGGLESVKARLKELEERRAAIERETGAVASARRPGAIKDLAAKVKARIGKTREMLGRFFREGRKDVQAYRQELAKYVKAIRVYPDGLVRVIANMTGATEGAAPLLSKVGSGGGI